MVGVDGAGLFEGVGGQRAMGEAVDLGRQAVRALEQSPDGGGLKKGHFAPGEAAERHLS